jgi:cytochrome c oxidase subunit 2
MTAPEGDVIHSFWVPELAGKRDAIPGQLTAFELVPERTGRFEVICGEFCGLQHAAMRGEVQVVPQAEFEQWLAEQERAQARPDAALGGTIYAQVCSTCHGPEVVGEVGPRLEGNALLGNARTLEGIVRGGRGAMPAVGQDWTENEMRALIEFTRTLAGGTSGG